MTIEKTAIEVRKPDVPAIYGNRDELAALATRMRVMLNAKDAPDDIMYKAAQTCMAYRLMPGDQVHVYKIGKNWVVDTGIDAWKLEAKRQCDKRGDTFYIPTPRPMTPDEVKESRKELYDPRDRGSVATLYLKSEARFCTDLGIKYEGHTACGFWRIKGKMSTVWEDNKPTDKKEFKEDTVPESRTAQDVADRRAIKKVIKDVFAFDLDTHSDEGYEVSNARLLRERIETSEREQKQNAKYTAFTPEKKMTSLTDSIMDAEPLTPEIEEEGEFLELQAYANEIGTSSQEVQTLIDETVAPEMFIATNVPDEEAYKKFIGHIFDTMSKEARGYAKELTFGPLGEDGKTIDRADETTAVDDTRLKNLRQIVNKACGWVEGESICGVPKANYVIDILGSLHLNAVWLSLATARQMLTDWAKNHNELIGREKSNKVNGSFSETRFGIMRDLGKLVEGEIK